MTAAVATHRKTSRERTLVSLREDFHRGRKTPLRVDREAGVIHGIKILGWESANRRRYEREAVRKALPMYEGTRAFADHPATPNRMRDSADALGVWRNPRLEEDGVYADLHFFRGHSLAENVCEDAERGLGVFGASHNADGKGEHRDGVFVVQEITEVRSVDLVTEPATVSNLWESRAMPQVSVRSVLLEKVMPAMRAGRARRLKALAESIPDTVTMLEGENGDEHHDHIYGAMKACKEAGDHDNAMALHKMLKPQKPNEDEELPEADDEEEKGYGDAGIEGPTKGSLEEDDEGEEKDDDGVAEEGRRRPRRRARGVELLTEKRAMALCKTTGILATADLLEAMVGATLDRGLAVLALARRQRAEETPAPVRHLTPAAPRSAPRGAVPVSEGVAPKDARAWAERLLG